MIFNLIFIFFLLHIPNFNVEHVLFTKCKDICVFMFHTLILCL